MTDRKRKHLYSITEDGVSTTIGCYYYPKYDSITIITGRSRSGAGLSRTNKKCSNYLGITIAERILSKIFKNVQRMPNCTPGYDFICGKGFKIDVKSSTLKNYKTRKQWAFSIRKNKTADYFLCVVFDNRDNLNPEHLWLIPGKILNSKITAVISKSTVDKWSEYELTTKLNDVKVCCDKMKGE